MQTLFRIEHDTNTPAFRFNMWEYTREGLEASILKIQDFRHAFPQASPSSHLIVKLIQSINISRTLTLDRYLLHVSSVALNTATALNLTSALNKGKVHDGEFYGTGSREIVLAHTSVVDMRQLRDNWQSMEPLKVLTHNQTNMGMLPPDGKTTSSDKGICVLAIDIPLLMGMYYMFNQQQDVEESVGKARRTVAQFVDSYVFANAVRSHTDHAIFNRLVASHKGLPSLPAFRKHSFFLTDYSGAIDTVQEQQIAMISKMPQRISGIMKAIPMVSVANLQELSELPRMARTYQCLWALTISRLKMLAFLLTANQYAENRNGNEVANIQRILKAMNVRAAVRNNLGMEDYYAVAPYLDQIGA